MATRYTLDARITGTNESSGAWREASNEARGFAEAIREIPNEVNVGIDLENVSNDITQLNERLREGVNDVRVGIDFESVTNDIAQLNARLRSGVNDLKIPVELELEQNAVSNLVKQLPKRGLGSMSIPVELELSPGAIQRLNARLAAGLRDQKVNVEVDYDRNGFAGIARGANMASESLENLTQNEVDVGQQAIRTSNVIRSSGFLALLGGIGVAAYAIGPAFQAATGGAIAFGAAGASAGVGAGLLLGAIVPSITRFSDYNEAVKKANTALESAEKGTKEYKDAQKDLAEAQAILTRREKELFNNWERLGQSLSSDKGFNNANKNLIGLANDATRLADRIIPKLGREASEVGRDFDRAARQVARGWGNEERNSASRILDNASDVTAGLTRTLGRLGEGLLNTIGSPAATRGARQLVGHFEDMAKSFRDWSRTERAREAIADWLDRAKVIGKAAEGAIGDIAKALGRFDDEDAKNVAEAIKAIGKFAGTAVDDVRKLGRGVGDLVDWSKDANKGLDTFIDRLDGSRKGMDRLNEKVSDFAGKGPSHAGWALAEWLKDQNKDHQDWRKQLDKSSDEMGQWGGTVRRNTKNARDDWNEHIGQKVIRGVINDLNDALDNNDKKTDKWQKGQDKNTNETEQAWRNNIYQRIVDFILPGFDAATDDNNVKIQDWAKKNSQFTADAEDSWKTNVSEGIVKAVLPTYAEALFDAAGKTEEWADKVKEILNGILSWLGMGNGDDGVDHQSGSGSSRPQGEDGRGGAQGLDVSVVRRMAEGGLARNDEMERVGGVLKRPTIIAGEAGDEAIVPLTRKTPQGLDAAVKGAQAQGLTVVNDVDGDLRVHHANMMAKGGILRVEDFSGGDSDDSDRHQDRSRGDRLVGRTDDSGPGAGQFGRTNNNLWDSETFGRVLEVLKRFKVSANTYENHPPGYPGLAGKSADFWDYAGRGTPISLDLDHQVHNFITSTLRRGLSWSLHEGDAGHSGGTRHVHGTWKGADPTIPNVPYRPVSGGAPVPEGGSSGPSLDQILERIEGAIPDLALGLGPYGEQLSGAIKERVFDAIEKWAADLAGSFGGGEPSGNSPRGLTISEAVTQGGWPQSKHADAVGTVWEESGGAADNEVPGNPYKGLFAMGPSAFQEVGMSYSKVFDPIYNSTAANRLQQKLGWQPWAASWPIRPESKRMGDQPVTGYAEGGIHEGRDLPIRMPERVEDAFLTVAQSILSFTRHKGAISAAAGRAFAGIEIGDEGGVGDGRNIVAITNEAGREAVAPLDRWTHQGYEATKEAMKHYFPGLLPEGMFARGGMVPRSGWDLVGKNDTMKVHGPAAGDLMRAVRQHVGNHGANIEQGNGVYVEWAEGQAAGTTSSSGRIRVDRHLKGSVLGMKAMAHEALHGEGLDHDGVAGSLMNATIGPRSHIRSATIRTLEAMYGNAEDSGGWSKKDKERLYRHLDPEGVRRARKWFRHHDSMSDDRKNHLLDRYGTHEHRQDGGGPGGGGSGGGNEDDSDKLTPEEKAEQRAESHNRKWHATHGGRDPFYEDPYGYGKERPTPSFYDENRHYGPSKEDFPQWPYRGEGPAERAEKNRRHRGGGRDPRTDSMHRPAPRGDSSRDGIDSLRRENNEANRMFREIWRDIREQLKDVGINLPSQMGIGQFASGGTLEQLRRNPQVKQLIGEALREYESNRREWQGARG